MSVDNVPLFGSAFAPSDTTRDEVTPRSGAAEISFSDFRRQLVALELLILVIAGGLAALIVGQANSAGRPLLTAAVFTSLWALTLAARHGFSLANVDSFEGLKRIGQATAIAFGVVAGFGLVLSTMPFRDQILWTV
ncbi:MAG: hypothetical protein WC054_13290, partial [Candidatus Nanopelagicales bacterium]